MMILQVGVKAFLRRADGQYLLLRRSAEKYPEVSDRWDIVGGRIDVGQSLLTNLRREVKEETGLEISEPIKLIAAQDILKSAEKHVVRLTYFAAVQGEPRLEDEHDDFGWFTVKQMLAKGDLDEFAREILTADLL